MESIDSESTERMPILPIQTRWNMLAVGVGLALLGQIANIMQALRIEDLIERIKGGDAGAGYELMRSVQKVDPLAILASLVYVLSVVFVCMWFFRAAQNIQIAGLKFLNYAPGWHVGWFFIPLANLVMPFITSIELFKANASINNPEQYSSWNTNKLSIFVVLWYFSFIVMFGIGFYIGFSNFDNMRRMTFDPDAMVDYFSTVPKSMYFQIPLQTLSGVSLIIFSRQITQIQNQYINQE